jgi:hypothetical protein
MTALAQPVQIVVKMLKILLKQVAGEKDEKTSDPRYKTAGF